MGSPGLAGATYGVPLANMLLSGLLEQALVVRNAVLAVDEAGEKVVSVKYGFKRRSFPGHWKVKSRDQLLKMRAFVMEGSLTYPAIVYMCEGKCWKRVLVVVMRWADEG